MSDPVPYRVEPLGSEHRRAEFSSGVEALDRYFRQHAGQDARRHAANCFVGVHKADGSAGGFYTLSATSVLLKGLPEHFQKKLPRYPDVPAALLGRLAVDLNHRGRGLGAFLLFDAMRRTLLADLAAAVLIADAKDSQASAFYRHYEFQEIGLGGKRLFLPVSKIAKIFA